MSFGFRTFINGLRLFPKVSSTSAAAGELEVLSGDNKLRYNDGSTNSIVPTVSSTDTLTNKTLTAPVISTIVNTGTLTLPTSTDTLVGRATTDTLTNKSMSGSTNTFTNLPTSGLTGVVAIANGGTNNGSLAVTAGGSLYTDGSKVANTGAGSAGQVLTSNGASAPNFQTIPSLAKVNPTTRTFLTPTSSTYNLNYAFFITSGSATVGATYTNNSVTFTVYATVASATLVYMSGSGAPSSSGTLTKASGTGDATITFSSYLAPYYIKVSGVAGGGGGGAAGSTAGTGGGAGGNTTFGSSLLSAIGGAGGNWANTGSEGGGATVSAPALRIKTVQGGSSSGSGLSGASSGSSAAGTSGGNSALGGGAGGGPSGDVASFTGKDSPANTGGGGGGGGNAQDSANNYVGTGGGAGGYFEAIINNPSSSYNFVVAAAGTAGSPAGTGGGIGGTGGSGMLVVEEYY